MNVYIFIIVILLIVVVCFHDQLSKDLNTLTFDAVKYHTSQGDQVFNVKCLVGLKLAALQRAKSKVKGKVSACNQCRFILLY